LDGSLKLFFFFPTQAEGPQASSLGLLRPRVPQREKEDEQRYANASSQVHPEGEQEKARFYEHPAKAQQKWSGLSLYVYGAVNVCSEAKESNETQHYAHRDPKCQVRFLRFWF
jgi:hypothetical protein